MRLTAGTIILALSTTALGAARPDANTGVSNAPGSGLYPRAIYCPCTSTRTCGCGEGSWCHCEEPNDEHSKAYCSKNKVCGCPGGSYGYCVVSISYFLCFVFCFFFFILVLVVANRVMDVTAELKEMATNGCNLNLRSRVALKEMSTEGLAGRRSTIRFQSLRYTFTLLVLSALD